MISASPVYSHIPHCQPVDENRLTSESIAYLAPGGIPYPKIDITHVIRIFLESVGKGELVLFDRVIEQTAIQPERVEYVYSLDEQMPIVKVYAVMKDLMYLPTAPEIRVKGISAIINSQGRIVEVVAHCGS